MFLLILYFTFYYYHEIEHNAPQAQSHQQRAYTTGATTLDVTGKRAYTTGAIALQVYHRRNHISSERIPQAQSHCKYSTRTKPRSICLVYSFALIFHIYFILRSFFDPMNIRVLVSHTKKPNTKKTQKNREPKNGSQARDQTKTQPRS